MGSIPETLLVQVFKVEVVALAITMGLLFGRASYLWWDQAWNGPREKRAQQILARAVEQGRLSGSHVQWLKQIPERVLVRTLTNLARNLQGASQSRLTVMARALGLEERATALCTSRRWWRRLKGVQWFMWLDSGQQVVPHLLRDPHPLVRAQVVKWIADHPTPSLIVALVDALDDPDEMSRFAVKDSMHRIGAGIIAPLVRYLTTHSGPEVEPALTVAAGLTDKRLLQPVLALSGHGRPTVRSLAATVLGTLGGADSVKRLEALLHDAAPPVRAAAARALGSLDHWPSAPHLAGLLRDSAWEVRQEAGRALRDLGAPGTLYLRRALTDPDHFAADMARQILNLPPTVGGTMSS